MENSFTPDLHARILIIDDDPMMRLLMREALDDGTYDIEEFENGADALKDIQQKIPDMILLDVKMPGMSGFDVCTQIREKYDENSVSIVVVTGLDDSDSIERAFNLGATAFINKPINPTTLPHRIKYLLQARNAFIALKQRETHLEQMDKISRILTYSNNLEVILQEIAEEMLNIFTANSVFIFSSDDVKPYDITAVCHATSEQCHAIADNTDRFIKGFSHNTFYRAKNSEYPVVIKMHPADSCQQDGHACLKTIMIKALHPLDDQTWYIIMHRCAVDTAWLTWQQETFYRISIRLSSILSHHLLLQRLHESESLLRQAQHIGKLGNWSINVKTGGVIWSDEIYRIYGYEPGDFTPTLNTLHEHTLYEDINRLNHFEQNAFYSGKTASIEYRIQHPDNKIHWIHKQGIGKFDDQGHLIAVNGTLQDITERILKQEQELHDHKMDAVGQLTSGIAHDFGNLMTIAKGNLELINDAFMQHYQIESDDWEIIEDARSAVYDGVKLTKQLLAFSRKKSIAPKPLNIESSIQNFSNLFKKTLGDIITLSLKIQHNLPDILVDKAQFESSLLNAVINARDAMPKGGHMTIHAKLHHKPPRSLLFNSSYLTATSYICINIADTGEGMRTDVLKHVTEPFFTTKKETGTGLGLSMIYGFMRQSNGALNITSKPGKGTCVSMYFPVCPTTTIQAENAPIAYLNTTTKVLTKTLTILVVEDREAVRRFAMRCLKNANIHILQAENASAAIELLNNNPTVHLLFSDILMLGDMNGRDLATWVRNNRPEIKILLTTASERESHLALSTHTNDFQMLPKPYSQQDLLNKINTIFQEPSAPA